MSVWKSPVLYFGVLLVIAVAAALLAPFVYDWNSYRGQLEAYGHKLTGRDVKIAGGISVRLFPWPRLTADDVHIANPQSLTAPDFASAERVTVNLQLAGLLNGNIQVESIDIDRPVVSLERQATGQGNWQLQPAAELLHGDLAARIKLDRITLTDAIIHLRDDRRSTGDVELAVPRMTVMAPGLQGPWRAEAESVGFDGQHFAASLTTGLWSADQPLRFGVTVRPAADGGALAGLGYAFGFDGESDKGRLSGYLRLEPAAAGSGKGDAEGALRRLLLSAKVTGDFDKLDLADLQVGPADPAQGGALITGTAHVDLGRTVAASVDLTANKLDLAAIAGARVNAALRQGGVLAAADTLLSMLPDGVQLSGAMHVAALQTETETLENIALKVDAGREAIRVQELSASLPGRAQALFRGVFFPGQTGAELAGTLALEANDLRQFTTWVWPEARDRVGKVWAGSRGHFKLQSDVNLTEADLRFSKAKYELDGVPGSFELQVAAGGRGSVDLRLDATRLDIDNIAGGALAKLNGGGAGAILSLLPVLVPQRDSPDLRLIVQADELLLNGVSAKDVTLDAAAGGNGLDLRTLELGSVGGAKLSASGLVLDAGKGPDGSVGLDIAADDPRGLLRLAGLIPADRDPDWAKALGATGLKGTLTVKAGDTGPVIGFDVAGSSGDFDFSGSGNASSTGALPSGSFDIKSKTSAAMARLAGLTAAAEDQSPGHIAVTASTSAKGGYLADIQAQLFGVQASFNGTVEAPDAIANGKLSLRSTDVSTLAAATGMPLASLPRSLLVLDATLGGDAHTLAITGISGRYGEAKIEGDLALAAGPKLTGKLNVGETALTDLLPAVFLGWYGTTPSLESNFAARLPFGLTGEVWLTPRALVIGDAFRSDSAQIGISADGKVIRLAAFGKDSDGRDAKVEIASGGSDADRTLDGKITLPVDLSRHLKLAGGGAVAEGTGNIEFHFNTVGRSPGGALASLKGSGSYAIDGLRFTNISPHNFTQALAAAKDAAGLNAAFDALRGPGGLPVATARGSITAENGIASFLPISVSTADANALIRTTADLTAGQIDIGVELDLKARGDLPRMEAAYAGPPGALARSEDKAELANKLGITIMQQGVAELEKLQQEQQRLAALEEQQRKEDEAKLAAYYAQRDELLLRRRELKVFSEMRLAAAEKLRQEIEAQRANNAEINRAELIQRRHELKVFRKLAAAEASQPFQIEVTPASKPSAPKPAPKPQAKPAVPGGGVVIVPPSQDQSGQSPSQ